MRSRVTAVIAVMAGARAGICAMAVPILRFSVWASSQVIGVMASVPYASATQPE